MDRATRRIVAQAAFAVALVLFLAFFVRPLWAWATWDRARGTLDLGLVTFTNRPPFPSDVRSVLVGLVLPIVLATAGRILPGARTDGE